MSDTLQVRRRRTPLPTAVPPSRVHLALAGISERRVVGQDSQHHRRQPQFPAIEQRDEVAKCDTLADDIRKLKRQMRSQANAIQQMQEAIIANQQLLMGMPGGMPVAAVLSPTATPAPPVARGEMPFKARRQLLGRLEKLASAELHEALDLSGVDRVPGALSDGQLDLGALDAPRLWRLYDFCDVATHRAAAASTGRATGRATGRRPAVPRSRKRRASSVDLAEVEADIEERLAEVRAARTQLLGGAAGGSGVADEWLDEPRNAVQKADEENDACATTDVATDADVETDVDMATDADALLCQFDDSDGEDAW